MAVRISPKWLDAMIPASWMQAASRLEEIVTAYRLTDEQIREFITISQSLPVPMVEAVERLARKEWLIEYNETKTAFVIVPGLLLPQPGELIVPNGTVKHIPDEGEEETEA